MRRLESKFRKISITVFYGLAALGFLIIGSLHASRAMNAGRINEEFTDPVVTNAYDACAYPAYIPSDKSNNDRENINEWRADF